MALVLVAISLSSMQLAEPQKKAEIGKPITMDHKRMMKNGAMKNMDKYMSTQSAMMQELPKAMMSKQKGQADYGKELFASTDLGTNGQSCSSCHPDGGTSGGTVQTPMKSEVTGTPQEAFLEGPIVEKFQCVTCHTITDKGGTVGPILNLVGLRRTPEWLDTWLEEPDEEFVVDPDSRGLANVVVRIEGVTAGKPFDAAKAQIEQLECRYVPRISVVRPGREFDIVNQDPVLHNVHAYRNDDTLFNLAQPFQGQASPQTVNEAGATGSVEFRDRRLRPSALDALLLHRHQFARHVVIHHRLA